MADFEWRTFDVRVASSDRRRDVPESSMCCVYENRCRNGLAMVSSFSHRLRQM